MQNTEKIDSQGPPATRLSNSVRSTLCKLSRGMLRTMLAVIGHSAAFSSA